MTLPLTGPHWDFALALYGSDGVADACLELQDRRGLDIPVLLMSLFAARQHGLALQGADISAADALVRSWRSEVVVPLRTLRRRMKAGFEAIPTVQAESLRSSIKEVELHAEQLEIARLALWFASLAPRRSNGHVDLAAVAMRVVETYAPAAKCIRPEDALLVAHIATAATRCGPH